MPPTFDSLEEATATDWKLLQAAWTPFLDGLAERVLSHLQLMTYDLSALPVTQYEHCLQTATRAHRAGRDEEYVVCALLHDIGDMLAPANHAEFAATLLKPYVSERNHWMLAQHGIFQGHYFFHHWGMDRSAREKFVGHPNFAHTVEFCELFDQTSFQRGYDTMPLEAFRPMVARVLSVNRLTTLL